TVRGERALPRMEITTMLSRFVLRCVVSCLAVLAIGLPAARSQSFVTVTRVGDGSAALTSAATAVFLDSFSGQTGANLNLTVALPVADNGANQILTLSGTGVSEGVLTRSLDGRFLTLAGYDAAPGTANVAATAAAAVNRVIGRIDLTVVPPIVNTATR